MNDRWKRVFLVIMTFYVFDFISTFRFCPNPDFEQGPFPHFFMKITNSVFLGLVLNILFSAVIVAIILFIARDVLRKTHGTWSEQFSKKIEVTVFIWIGYLPVIIFWGATSWFWFAPDYVRITTGIVLYLLSLVWVKPSARGGSLIEKA